MNRRTKETLRLFKEEKTEGGQTATGWDVELTSTCLFFYFQSVGIPDTYSTDRILELIGDESTEIPDDIIRAAFEVIKANSQTNTAEYMGFYTPAQLHFMTTEIFSKDDTPHPLPVDKDSLHIHPLSGHWVTSFYDSVLKQLFVYDSLHSLSHQKEVELQLRQIYSSEIVNSFNYVKVTQQSAEPICGVMAIAFAFSCFLRQNPSSVSYDITKAREHLRHCLSSGTVCPFPALSIDSENGWFKNYLNTQQKNASAQRMARSRERRSTEKVKSDREKDNFSKKESRKKRAPYKILNDKIKDTLNKREIRKMRNEDKVLKDRYVNTSRQRERRNRRTLHEILKDKDRDKASKRVRKERRNQDKILKDKSLDTASKRVRRERRSQDRILKDKDLDTASKRVRRERRSQDRILKDKDMNTARKRMWRERRSQDRIIKDTDMDTANKRVRRERRSQDRILKDKDLDTASKRVRRERRSRDRILKDKDMNTASKRMWRERRSQDRILKDKDMDSASKKDRRKRRSQDEYLKSKDLDTANRKERRKNRNQDTILKDKSIDTESKKGRRKKRSRDKIHKDKAVDTASKRERRQSRTIQQVCTDKETDKKRKRERRHPSDILGAIKDFKEQITESPEYICTVCHRTLYRNSVIRFKETTQLSHLINSSELSSDGNQYICCTCKRYVDKNETPPQAQSNRMTIPKPPNILTELTDFQARLLAKRYPFMKIVQLPKGRQRGIIGQVVNVPVDAEDLCSTLPRTIATSGIIPVKLKRKKAYKGHVFYQNIRPQKIREAFQWLMKNNKHYQNIVECADWESKCKGENADTWQQLTQQDPSEQDKHEDDSHQSAEVSSDDEISTGSDTNVSDDDLYKPAADDSQEATQFDTCIQPSDPAADASKILTVAPGEGRHPLHVMMDPSCEEQSFPCLFPTGCFGFDAQREVKITPKKYFNARVLNKDGNFSKNVEYLFFAQYITEHKQVMDSASVAVRKSYQASSSQGTLDASFIKDPERLKSLILKDKAYHFLQTIRGSPPYWQKAMFKLMAAVKQFGIFTFFVTLSSVDLKWTDTLNAILRQQGRQLTEEEINDLPWEDRCSLLRSNPVTTARHFDHRLQTFISCILLGKAQPLGKIKHYSYRIEFQQRGSPHAHCVIWTEDAPKPADSKKIVAEFIDKYITCHIPPQDENPELYSLVTSVQKHHHTATCRKKGTTCRFNYPKMPSQDTMIACELDTDDVQLKQTAVKSASEVLSNVMMVLEGDKHHEIESMEELLAKADVTNTQYTTALGLTKRGKAVILERGTNEIYINKLLLAWQANLDVQYCVDPYGCIAYMVNYITKDEREMSVTLQNVTKEKQHCDWKEQLKACASAFLNAREVSAQEAVYRILSFPLFKSNFSTVFVAADLPSKRVAFLKPVSMINAMEDEEEDIFATSMLDRYIARPNKLEDCCLAHFAISYTTSYSTTTEDSDEDMIDSGTTITLKNGLGVMKKRAKKAVLCYHHKSQSKEPEEYFYSQLLLFLPWRDGRLELLKLSSYEDHYYDNKDTIETNRSEVEHHAEIISLAVEQFETFGPPVHAFDEISPNTEQENQEEQLIGMEEDPDFAVLNPDHGNIQAVLNDIPVASTASSSLEIRPGFFNEDACCKHLRLLNLEQRDTFQIVYQWCRDTSVSHKTGNVPKPLYLFVSGGAGTGKSHLITRV